MTAGIPTASARAPSLFHLFFENACNLDCDVQYLIPCLDLCKAYNAGALPLLLNYTESPVVGGLGKEINNMLLFAYFISTTSSADDDVTSTTSTTENKKMLVSEEEVHEGPDEVRRGLLPSSF